MSSSSSHQTQHTPRWIRFARIMRERFVFYAGNIVNKIKDWSTRNKVPEKFATVKQTYSPQNLRRKAISALKTFSYWSGVCTLGLVIAVGIMHVTGVPLLPTAAHAGVTSFVISILMSILYALIILPLMLLVLVFGYIFQIVATYPYGTFWTIFGTETGGGFVQVSGVIVGWTLVRDICNVFFAIVLVIIALGTVLNIEGYQVKQLLGKFIVAAILVNFSRTICGIFTDFATVAMSTFAGSFANSFITGIFSGFGLPSALDLIGGNTEALENNSAGTALAAYVTLVIILVALLPMIITFAAILIFRIVMLWFLIAISPFAFFCSILPQTKKYASEWWQKFGNMVALGPLITFFLWLALTMAFSTEDAAGPKGTTTLGASFASAAGAAPTSNSTAATKALQPPAAGPFQVTSPNLLSQFLIMYILLAAGMKLSMSMAGEIGGMVGKVGGLLAARGVAKSGQILGRLGMAGGDLMGGSTRAGKIGDFIRGSGKALSTAAPIVGATLFQPGKFLERLKKNYLASSDAKQKNFEEVAAAKASGLAKLGVLRPGEGEGRFSNFAKSFVGATAGAGLEGGDKHFDDFFSSDPLIKTARYAWGRRKKGDISEEAIAAEEASLKNAERDKKLAETRLTDEEAVDVIKQHKENSKEYTETSALQNAHESGNAELELGSSIANSIVQDHILPQMRQQLRDAEAAGDVAKVTEIKKGMSDLELLTNQDKRKKVDTDLEATRSSISAKQEELDHTPGTFQHQPKRKALEKELSDLRAAEATIQQKANFLQTNTKANGTVDLQHTLNQFLGPAGHGAVNAGVKNLLEGKTKGLKGKLQDSKKRLVASGATDADFDSQYNIQGDVKGKLHDVISVKDRDTARTTFNQAENQKKVTDARFASFKPRETYKARMARQRRVSEAHKEIADIHSSEELLGDYMYRAIEEGNIDLFEACMMRVAENGNASMLTKEFMAFDIDTKKVDEAAGTGPAAVHNFIEKILKKKFHLSNTEARSRWNDIGEIGQQKGNLNMGGTITYEGREWKDKAAELFDTDGKLMFDLEKGEAKKEYKDKVTPAQQAAFDKIFENQARDMGSATPHKASGWGTNDWGYVDHTGDKKLLLKKAIPVLRKLGTDLATERYWHSMHGDGKYILAKNREQLRNQGIDPKFISLLDAYWHGTGSSLEEQKVGQESWFTG